MSKLTDPIMRKIKRDLVKVVGMHITACGYEERMERAIKAEEALLEYIETQLEAASKKAGIQ